MRVVFDLQKLQESCIESENNIDSGLEIFRFVVEEFCDYEFFAILNGALSNSIEPIRAKLRVISSKINVRVWYPWEQLSITNYSKSQYEEVSESIRNFFISDLKPDFLFEIVGEVGGRIKRTYRGDCKKLAVIDESFVDMLQNASEDFYSNNIRMLKNYQVVVPASNLITSNKLSSLSGRCLSDINISEISIETFRDFFRLTSSVPILLPGATSSLKKLAYFSPMPPAKSGVSDYSVVLLRELSNYYVIDLITDQEQLDVTCLPDNCNTKSLKWFNKNFGAYDRVLYHFGNSAFHAHMFDVLDKVPGVVVLHDFFLGDVQYYRANNSGSGAWQRKLYASHGYTAVLDSSKEDDVANIVRKYPANHSVIRDSLGIISHSYHSKKLAADWYSANISQKYKVVPLLRDNCSSSFLEESRRALKLKDSDFVVCSFGLLGATKLNHRLLQAFLKSDLFYDTNCLLIFVGEVGNDRFGQQLRSEIKKSGVESRILITGWVDSDVYSNYLKAADVAVQLRSHSRGETSAAALDCMSFALPTIVNSHGAMAELPNDSVWMLSDEFTDEELVAALERLKEDKEARSRLGKKAYETISNKHSPEYCAQEYFYAIESFYVNGNVDLCTLSKEVAGVLHGSVTDHVSLARLSESVAKTFPSLQAEKKLFVDVSAVCKNDLGTGIQRVVKSLVTQLITSPPSGYRVEPIYLTDDGNVWHYKYAREWTSNHLRLSLDLEDSGVEFTCNDQVLVADFTSGLLVEAHKAGVYSDLKEMGVDLFFVIYDLLPITMPYVFPPNQFGFSEWLEVVAKVADKAICISEAVAEDLAKWVSSNNIDRYIPLEVSWFHLGAEISGPLFSGKSGPSSAGVLNKLKSSKTFLMVGTIEPRKGYDQAIKAFEKIWEAGFDINLVIVGREGWKGLPDNQRRNIPDMVRLLKNHSELGRHLFWLSDADDALLDEIYKNSSCLLAASYAEGFGLPLIEAAQYGLPILARDINVFKEVAGEYACYFNAKNSEELAVELENWLELYKKDVHKKPSEMPWLSWSESAEMLKSQLGMTS